MRFHLLVAGKIEKHTGRQTSQSNKIESITAEQTRKEEEKEGREDEFVLLRLYLIGVFHFAARPLFLSILVLPSCSNLQQNRLQRVAIR